MSKEFHRKQFGSHTKSKLFSFQMYVREWLPVFLSDSVSTRTVVKRVNIFDAFAGPGRDAHGDAGSPLLIVEELKQYCQKRPTNRRRDLDIHLYFNDKDPGKVESLRAAIEEVEFEDTCCHVHISNEDFDSLLVKYLGLMAKEGSANLFIADPFGFKFITDEAFCKIVAVKRTDLLFFTPSSYLKRFARQPCVASRIGIDAGVLANTGFGDVHRFLTKHYRNLARGLNAFVNGFCLQAGRNYYGLIFASKVLLGLEKHIDVCWKIDGNSGQANFNIDGDPSYGGQLTLLPEADVSSRVREYKVELISYLKEAPRTNRELYVFSLERGLRAKDTREILKNWQSAGDIIVRSIGSDAPPRKGAFYLGWKHYNSGQDQIVVEWKAE